MVYMMVILYSYRMYTIVKNKTCIIAVVCIKCHTSISARCWFQFVWKLEL